MPKSVKCKNTVKLSGARDLPLLRSLWKWKLLSTSALSAKFFPGLSPITAYKRLWKLSKHGYIRSVSLAQDGRSFAWSLDKLGYQAMKHALPALYSDGYKSEHLQHDFVVSAFHLGGWLGSYPESVRLFSEQQLRRYDFEFYPRVVPKTIVHRPDGYTVIKKGQSSNHVIAIEVELSAKKTSHYDIIYEFYDQERIDEVLWLVPRKASARRINNIFKRKELAHQKPIHSFLTYEDFRHQGWNATFICGRHNDRTVLELYGNLLETQAKDVSSKFLLDTRKSPHRSQVYQSCQISKIIE